MSLDGVESCQDKDELVLCYLKGPLGPETLKSRYGMDEGDILRLYRLLYVYSAGFCTAVLEPTQRAKYKEQLLELIFQTYAKLWDEALGVS